MTTDTTPGKYTFDFTEEEWTEIECLPMSLFEEDGDRSGHRMQWTNTAYLCLGKAQALDDGHFGEEDDEFDPAAWAAQLRGIAQKILDYFTPGDSKI